MPIDVRWGNDDRTVIHVTTTGSWTWDQHTTYTDKLRTMLDSVGYSVAVLYDAQEAKLPPDIFSHFEQLRNEAGLDHPNSALNVVVVSNRLVLNVIQSALRFFRADRSGHLFVRTREEAEKIAITQVARLQASAS